ncbi:hypothetical protein [Halalkalibacter alkalisediminis]|uniref:Uncharacterized protein n=1 Tax=Halalkalibacter alkalisediminis TaxID=935616 RepID=A0ABV6NL55_9BACI|nr:hypothetical protein [Halalkalibacter alkalisediminis]
MLFLVLVIGVGIGATAYSLMRDQTTMSEFSEELTTEPSKKAGNIDYEDLL